MLLDAFSILIIFNFSLWSILLCKWPKDGDIWVGAVVSSFVLLVIWLVQNYSIYEY
jgi:hypothetical protein